MVREVAGEKLLTGRKDRYGGGSNSTDKFACMSDKYSLKALSPRSL